jgi:hypothetical protein
MEFVRYRTVIGRCWGGFTGETAGNVGPTSCREHTMPRPPANADPTVATKGHRFHAAERYVATLRTGRFPLTDAQRRALADQLLAPLDDEPPR